MIVDSRCDKFRVEWLRKEVCTSVKLGDVGDGRQGSTNEEILDLLRIRLWFVDNTLKC